MGGLGTRQSSLKTATLVLLGVDEPYQYEAGQFVGTKGETISFPAGTSTRICVGTPGLVDFAEFKVKGRVFASVWPVLEDLDRGVYIDVQYREFDGREPEVVSVVLSADVTAESIADSDALSSR